MTSADKLDLAYLLETLIGELRKTQQYQLETLKISLKNQEAIQKFEQDRSAVIGSIISNAAEATTEAFVTTKDAEVK